MSNLTVALWHRRGHRPRLVGGRLKQFFKFCAPGRAARKILRGRDLGRARQTFQSGPSLD